jgi:hypothetical protein
VDITVNNILAIVNTKLLSDYVQIDERLVQLCYIVKHWAKRRQVHAVPRLLQLNACGYFLVRYCGLSCVLKMNCVGPFCKGSLCGLPHCRLTPNSTLGARREGRQILVLTSILWSMLAGE